MMHAGFQIPVGGQLYLKILLYNVTSDAHINLGNANKVAQMLLSVDWLLALFYHKDSSQMLFFVFLATSPSSSCQGERT
jgi:hypothetical protein